LIGVAEDVISRVFDIGIDPLIRVMRKGISSKTLDPKMFKKPQNRKAVEKLQKSWSESPTTGGEIAKDLLESIAGHTAEQQFEEVLGEKIDKSTPTIQGVFDAMALVADASLIPSAVGIVGECVSIGQIDRISEDMRAYMGSTGVTQIVGFGYGNILSSALEPKISQELNAKLRHQLLPPMDLLLMKWRGLITEDQYMTFMSGHGFADQWIKKWSESKRFYPGPNDFIRFGVREVFKKDIVEKYGYDQDFPTEIQLPAEKAGIDLEVLKLYWRAHWELPAPRMGYEMLHRGVIDEEDLRTLLKISDYAPAWIQNMIDISYSPYTRVDVRRMYKSGVIDEDEVYKTYQDLGYDSEHADNLTDWTILETLEKERDLSRSTIENAYKLSLIGRKSALDYIMGIGYDATEAEIYIDIIDERKYQKELEEEIDALMYQYSRDRITLAVFKQRLTSFGIPSEEAVRYEHKAQIMKDKIIRLPSKEDIIKWFDKQQISEDDAFYELKNLGYSDRHTNLYIWGDINGKPKKQT